jgi:hypothetical protein
MNKTDSPEMPSARPSVVFGGEGGDRTHGPVARTAVFETARFGHSRTSPRGRARELTLGAVIFQSVFFKHEGPSPVYLVHLVYSVSLG